MAIILVFGGAVATDKATGKSSYQGRRVVRDVSLIGLEAHTLHWVIKNTTHYAVISEEQARRWLYGADA